PVGAHVPAGPAARAAGGGAEVPAVQVPGLLPGDDLPGEGARGTAGVGAADRGAVGGGADRAGELAVPRRASALQRVRRVRGRFIGSRSGGEREPINLPLSP